MKRVKLLTKKTELLNSHRPLSTHGQGQDILRYCSLDIETTGFDPLTEEILEVGFVFFEVTKKGINILEEWTQVFKPKKEVNSKILGLTGITLKELEHAPTFEEHKKFLQEKLGEAVIVGHNIVFDIRFLEQFGIKFSGLKIDTLDLVQWLLPTRHSYNLENLMHYFQVSHTEAHRALADAKATLKVLEKLLMLYSGFSKELKHEILNLIEPFDFAWKDWLNLELVSKEKVLKSKKSLEVKIKQKFLDIELESRTIYNFPIFYDYFQDILSAILKSKNKVILVLPKKSQVIDLWEKGLADPVFFGEDLFDEKKFLKYLKKTDKTEEEAKFLLKILIWKNTNWQAKCLLDLNLSFFGGQFKESVSKSKMEILNSSKFLVCDFLTFLEIVEQGKVSDRKAILMSLSDFESSLSSGIGQKVSWGHISYLLKGVYNPETQIGDEKYKDMISELLDATDLFFGLSCALLKNEAVGFEYFKVTESARYFENFVKLQKASESYLQKIKNANRILEIEALEILAKNLENFFKEEENRVKWIELADKRSVFFNSPLNLKNFTSKIIKLFPKTILVDSLPQGPLIDLFVSRLGLQNFPITQIETEVVKNSLQQDLFSKFVSDQNKIEYSILEKNLESSGILKKCTKANLPAAVLFSNPVSVKDFYESNFSELGKIANLLTQNQSGGSNKIFRNFSIYKESILLATDKFVLKFLENSNSSLEKLPVKTLIIGRLPFEQYTHPYLEAVAESFENPFEQFSLPRAILNLLKILRFFYTSELKVFILADSKLQKQYAKVFKEFMSSLQKFNLKI